MTEPRGSPCPRCGAVVAPGSYFCPRCGTSVSVATAAAETTVTTSPRALDAQHSAQLDELRQATLGEYELLAELGRGGMATVYLAHDISLDRKVAIKVLAPALWMMGEGMIERFKREARTAAALSHPHIIPIYAVKESPQVLYFVMKYVQGRPLDVVIRDVGPLPIAMVQAILAQVGDALGYAHRHGVIHRDVKSANIMLDEDGRAVVTDFGIAKVVQAEGLTLTGVTVGTPTYMSPEQCETQVVTGASDQYSLGVVAYEMLTGRLPFVGESTMAIMYAHFNERPRPVMELRRDCPANLGAGVMRMLEKDPVARWPSMDDVVAVCGRPSLRHDDPVRSEMITLAKARGRGEVLAQLNTPTSPIVPSRRYSRPGVAAAPGGRRAGLWWGLGGLGAVAIAAALWWLAPWRAWRSQAPLAPPAPSTLPAAASAPPVDTTSARPRPTPVRAHQPSRPPVRARQPAPDSVQRAAVALREDSLLRSLRAKAFAAMRRAREAGASPVDMAQGDGVFAAAESLAAQGRLSEAMVLLATAGSMWGEAERAARARAARDTTPPHAAEPPRKPAAPAVPVDPRPDIQKAMDGYARALETRDVGEVRRAYPSLTPAQQQSWKEFFQSVRNLKTALTVSAVSVTGFGAEAIVTGVYEYDNATTGRAERRPVTFRALLAVDSSGWHITTIR
ncbi:MAG TPA: protein kinase [Gemmatimonadales bacterium]|nr:protein kinase [Gemmatimonadales bacterium]